MTKLHIFEITSYSLNFIDLIFYLNGFKMYEKLKVFTIISDKDTYLTPFPICTLLCIYFMNNYHRFLFFFSTTILTLPLFSMFSTFLPCLIIYLIENNVQNYFTFTTLLILSVLSYCKISCWPYSKIYSCFLFFYCIHMISLRPKKIMRIFVLVRNYFIYDIFNVHTTSF